MIAGGGERLVPAELDVAARSAPLDRVRMTTVSPTARWDASVAPTPISTSSGCAPTASTVSVAPSAARLARPSTASAVMRSRRVAAATGLTRNSSASRRSASTA